MAKVTWTFQALEDLSEIAEHLALNSEKYASYIVELILDKGQLLETFPKLGRIVPEINLTSVRELIVKNYRVIYSSPNSDQVNILSIRHSSKPLGEISEL